MNKMIILIKYDYRWIYHFNEQMNLLKNHYFHKYNNKNKYEIFLITREKYKKSLQKKKYYEDLYLKNKILYYIIFIEKLFSKYVRKQLYKDLISLFKSSIISFILEYFGFKTKFKKYLPFL